jgi:hypothetical protein
MSRDSPFLHAKGSKNENNLQGAKESMAHPRSISIQDKKNMFRKLLNSGKSKEEQIKISFRFDTDLQKYVKNQIKTQQKESPNYI